MTVYIEYIFLNNLAVNYLVCYLTLRAKKEEVCIWRVLLAAAVGGVFSVLYPLVSRYGLVIKLLLSAVMVLLIQKKFASPKAFVSTACTFYLISFVFAGAALMLGDVVNEQSGLVPFTVCGGILIGAGCVRYSIAFFYERRQEKAYEYRVEIAGQGDCLGYYDSGNRLYDANHRPVIVLTRRLAETLCLPQTGEIAVNTVAGIKVLPTVELQFTVYYENGSHKLFCASAAVTDSYARDNYDIILHRDMGESHV